jgi:hypothetical protein
MSEQFLQDQIDAMNRKLDLILQEIELQQRHRREIEDLKDDLMRVGKDVYQSAVVELEDVHDYLQTGDILYLGKKLLRNVTTLTRMFEQLESMRDFLQDAAPLARESFIDFMHTLDEFDRKGYFAFMRELGRVADKVVTPMKRLRLPRTPRQFHSTTVRRSQFRTWRPPRPRRATRSGTIGTRSTMSQP